MPSTPGAFGSRAGCRTPAAPPETSWLPLDPPAQTHGQVIPGLACIGRQRTRGFRHTAAAAAGMGGNFRCWHWLARQRGGGCCSHLVGVWVVLFGQLIEGFFNVAVAGRARHAKYRVKVEEGRCRASAAAGSGVSGGDRCERRRPMAVAAARLRGCVFPCYNCTSSAQFTHLKCGSPSRRTCCHMLFAVCPANRPAGWAATAAAPW